MKYCINVVNSIASINYRLQKDYSWATCDNPQNINENDFVTSDRQVILDLQKPDLELSISGRPLVVNLIDDELDASDLNVLFYEVFGFFTEYPTPPDRQQFEQLILNGNSAVNNTLILKTDGRFYLVPSSSIEFERYDPNIVMQFEVFRAGSHFVGVRPSKSEFDRFIQSYFYTAMCGWLDLLTHKALHYHVDSILKCDGEDEILNVFIKLHAIKTNWDPIV